MSRQCCAVLWVLYLHARFMFGVSFLKILGQPNIWLDRTIIWIYGGLVYHPVGIARPWNWAVCFLRFLAAASGWRSCGCSAFLSQNFELQLRCPYWANNGSWLLLCYGWPLSAKCEIYLHAFLGNVWVQEKDQYYMNRCNENMSLKKNIKLTATSKLHCQLGCSSFGEQSHYAIHVHCFIEIVSGLVFVFFLFLAHCWLTIPIVTLYKVQLTVN